MGLPSCHMPADPLGSTVIGPLVAAVIAAASVMIGGLPRVLLAADALPAWLRPLVWSDVLHIWERGVRGDQIPYRDVFFEYPPLTGAAWTLVQSMAGSAATHVAFWLVLQAAAAALVAYLIARSVGTRRSVLCWAAAPQLVLYGSVNFDTLAVAALVAGTVLARRRLHAGASAALTIGAALKLFPAVALPVVLLRAPVAARGRALAAIAVIAAVAFAPAAMLPHSSLLSLSRYSVGIEANPDSIWGMLAILARALGADLGSAVVALTLAGAAVTYLVVVIPAARRAADATVPIGLAVVTLLLWTRLYSPQYALWALPLFALVSLSRRTLATMTVADVTVWLSVYPLTLVRWPDDDPLRLALLGVLAGAVALRHVALIAAWRELLARSGRPATRTPAAA